MAFTKINAAGIGSTETVTLDGLTVINDGSFGGNVSVGGTLTYEDVTNVDSVGLITARNGIVVGSGITLSKDGDIFATGITTVSGNVKVGTGITLSPDGDGFFTGVVTATTFKGDGSQLSNVTSTTINNNADNRLITGSGTANTLEAEANITFDGTNLDLGDSKKIRLGASQDLELYHDGTNSYIDDTGTGSLITKSNHYIVNSGAYSFMNAANNETLIYAAENGAVQLYYNGTKHFETISAGLNFAGSNADQLQWQKSNNLLKFRDGTKAIFGEGDDLEIYHGGSHSWIKDSGVGNLQILSNQVNIQDEAASEYMAKFISDGAVELYHDNVKSVETTADGLKIQKTGSGIKANLKIEATNGGQAGLELVTSLSGTNRAARIDMYNQNALQWTMINDYQQNGTNDFSIKHGSEEAIRALQDGAVELYHNNVKVFETSSTGFKLVGDKSLSLDPWQGRLDRSWSDYPSIGISDSTTYGTQTEFRVHGIQGNVVGYGSGNDFSIDFRIDGNYHTGSDRRRKTNIEEITGALDTVKQLTGKKFNIINRLGELDSNKGTQKQFGLIAQECKDIIPEVVKFHADEDTPNENGWASAYGVDYGQLTPLLINAIKELSAKNDALETRIAALEG